MRGKLFSVIVLSKNNGRTIGYTLLSILKSIVPRGYSREALVVDAHSTDNTPRMLERFEGLIRVVYDEGRGIGIARNVGVLTAGASTYTSSTPTAWWAGITSSGS